MKFKIFTLYPQLFENFLSTSLIARAVSQDILNFELINWRNFGSGNYKQIDDILQWYGFASRANVQSSFGSQLLERFYFTKTPKNKEKCFKKKFRLAKLRLANFGNN